MSTPSSLPITSAGASTCTIGCGACPSAKAEVAQPHQVHARSAEEALLKPEERVLPTLEQDGSRRWMQPHLAPGDLWKWRRRVAFALIAFFVALPHLRIAGKPPILLDIPAREFTILGHTFLPTDTLLLALMMLGVFVTIVLGTAVAGRIWCGWGCPQTVYMEFLFRPIDRWFTGTSGRGGKPKYELIGWRRFARWGVYLVLSMFLAHTFLAYFVGTERLAQWVRQSPIDHPVSFLVMAATTGLMMFDFLFFREQLCMIACPYGRFQSVMLDRRSLIVAYDTARGEPRHKGKRKTNESSGGDCVDCNRCVAVCPTGIDIRDGLQLECIHCAQCIDACDEVMDRVGMPRGLIRYSSQDALEGKQGGWLRARTIIYPLILGVLATAFIVVLSTKFAFDVALLRPQGGAPFTVLDRDHVQNNLRIRLTNRSEETQAYSIQIMTPEKATVTWVDGTPTLKPGEQRLVLVVVHFPVALTAGSGRVDGQFELSDEAGNKRDVECQLLGPR